MLALTVPAARAEATASESRAASERAASSVSARERRRAKQHFERGMTHYNAGDFRAAVREFVTANELMPAPALQYNIGRAHEELGELPEAIDAFEAYLAGAEDAPDAQAVAARIAWLKETQAALEARSTPGDERGALRVALPTGASVREVLVDDEALPEGDLDGAVWLVPGRHRLEVTRERGPSFHAEVEVRASALTAAQVGFVEPAGESKMVDESGPSAWPVTLGVVGGVAMLTGTGLALASSGEDADGLSVAAHGTWIGAATVLAAAALIAALE